MDSGWFFNRYAITGTLSSPTLVETTVGVEIRTFGGQCTEVSQMVSFTLVPTPEVSLTSSSTLGTDRTVCTSETMVPIRFEIANPAFTLTEGQHPFPWYHRYFVCSTANDKTEVSGWFWCKRFGDTFTVTNGTPYTAATGSGDMATGTANLNEVHSEFAAFLANLPASFTVSATVVPFIEMRLLILELVLHLRNSSSLLDLIHQ